MYTTPESWGSGCHRRVIQKQNTKRQLVSIVSISYINAVQTIS